MDDFESYYRDMLGRMSKEELSYELSLMVEIRDRTGWYMECVTGRLLDKIWVHLVDETLTRAISRTLEPDPLNFIETNPCKQE